MQLSLWDTAGQEMLTCRFFMCLAVKVAVFVAKRTCQERFHALAPIYYRDADGERLSRLSRRLFLFVSNAGWTTPTTGRASCFWTGDLCHQRVLPCGTP